MNEHTPGLDLSNEPELIQYQTLTRAIDRVAQGPAVSVNKSPSPPNNKLIAAEYIDIGDDRVLAYAPCAVLNAVRSLGIETHNDLSILSRRLLAAHTNSPEDNFLLKPENSNMYWVATHGISKLFELVESPIRQKGKLPIKHFGVWDMGTMHVALVNGYTAVYVDDSIQHAITVGGVKQDGTNAMWIVIPPDMETQALVQRLGSVENYQVWRQIGQRSIVNGYEINPYDLIDVVSTRPAWIVGKNDNPWEPKDTDDEVEFSDEIIDLSDI